MDRRIELIISRMNEDPGSCEINALAESIKLSVSRFRHLFKQQTGTTPTRYLKHVRFKQAEILIRTTFLPIKEILIKVGVNSDSHFWREFRLTYGMSPAEYRDAHGLTKETSQQEKLKQ